MRTIPILLAIASTLCVEDYAQQSPSKQAISAGPIHSVTLEFKRDHVVPGLLASPALLGPLQCSSDGTVFMNSLVPPEFLHAELYAVSPSNEVHHFETARISDLYDVHVMDFFPSADSVALLVYATADKTQSEGKTTLSNGDQQERAAFTGTHHSYVVLFAPDGTYKKAVQVQDESLDVRRLGVFDNGTILVSGVHRYSKEPRLALLATDGSLLRLLDVPSSFGDLYKRGSTGSSTGPTIVPLTQMVQVGSTIVLAAPNSRSPVLEISPTGTVRAVKLALPSKTDVLQSMIPSAGRWYVRLISEADGGNTNPGDPALYQVDPTNGKLMEQFHTGAVNPAEIACAVGGRFISMETNDKQQFVIVTAEFADQ